MRSPAKQPSASAREVPKRIGQCPLDRRQQLADTRPAARGCQDDPGEDAQSHARASFLAVFESRSPLRCGAACARPVPSPPAPQARQAAALVLASGPAEAVVSRPQRARTPASCTSRAAGRQAPPAAALPPAARLRGEPAERPRAPPARPGPGPRHDSAPRRGTASARAPPPAPGPPAVPAPAAVGPWPPVPRAASGPSTRPAR